ncbi:MAG: EAL domain-containing protein, partial [Polyangiaceae bacterium]
PVILMTGEPGLESAVHAVEYGAFRYLAKPVERQKLWETVSRAARLHGMAKLKRQALELPGSDGQRLGERAALEIRFSWGVELMWMAFQPIVRWGEQGLFGYEALLRSNEPSLPHPGAVLEAAERLEKLHDLGRKVRESAAESFARAPAGASLFVNLHTEDLLDPTLYEAESPLSRIADRVVLEVTERATIDRVNDINARMSILRYLGYRIAVDDLGAGYAGLTSFAALEPEIVKLDMSLVRGIHKSTVRQRIVGSMVSLCKELKILVVAEGVETMDERDSILSLGCDILQGYFFARPGPPFPELKR